jgi:RNA polymerase sigma-70 factor, ECF subfamily
VTHAILLHSAHPRYSLPILLGKNIWGAFCCMLPRADGSDIDGALIVRIAMGDQLALRSLYVRHHLRIHRFLKRMLREGGAAEDVLAEVFLDVWRQAARFEGRSSVNTWLCGMARNKALAHLRKYPPVRTTMAVDEPADESDTPEIALQKVDKGMKLRTCINMLGQEHREVVDLVYYHEKSVDEVSLILGIPAATVKTRMFYARKKLSGLLAEAGLDRGWP